MKTELLISPHSIIPGANSVEVWLNDKLVATITGADTGSAGLPGVRVISKHPLEIAANEGADPIGLHLIEIHVRTP